MAFANIFVIALPNMQKQPPEVFFKKYALKNFIENIQCNIYGKTLVLLALLNDVADLRPER